MYNLILTICFAASHVKGWDTSFDSAEVCWLLGRTVELDEVKRMLVALYHDGMLWRVSGGYVISEKGKRKVLDGTVEGMEQIRVVCSNTLRSSSNELRSSNEVAQGVDGV